MITKYTEYIENNQFLKTYEEIKDWLDKMKIEKYTINKTLSVYVNDDVAITHKNLDYIPVKFSTVNGSFHCQHNNLTNLIGSPDKVNKSFFCNNNKLKTLEGVPYHIKRSFFCDSNPLENINDLNSTILIKSIINNSEWIHTIKQNVWDEYFEKWYRDPNIITYLEPFISNRIKTKYDYLFNAKNFDLL